MARTNVKTRTPTIFTHEGAPARNDPALKQLRRAVLSCLLWEDQFYEDGQAIADRIQELATKLPPKAVASIAVEARNKHNLRHVPLLLVCILAKTGAKIPYLVADTIVQVCKRADEPAELVALYWKLNPKKNGKNAPLSAQFKKGLSQALNNFDAYQLAKYNRDNDVRIRDVAFLSHTKPFDSMGKTFAQLVNKDKYPDETKASKFPVKETYDLGRFEKLESPDTWEVALSAGANKKDTFTGLLEEGKLGYLALLRNLRNMVESGVDRDLIKLAILARRGAQNVFPFRYVTAARYAPSLEPVLDAALIASLETGIQLSGKTIVLVDVSGSMDSKVSGKSEISRMDAAATLASIFPSNNMRVFTFSSSVVEVPARKGMAGIETIVRSQSHSMTDLGRAVSVANKWGYDRLVVITDEQSQTPVPPPIRGSKAYMINVASFRPSVAYGPWIKIEGFSEAVLKYIIELENFEEVDHDDVRWGSEGPFND